MFSSLPTNKGGGGIANEYVPIVNDLVAPHIHGLDVEVDRREGIEFINHELAFNNEKKVGLA